MTLSHRTVLVRAATLVFMTVLTSTSAQPADQQAKDKAAPLWTLETDANADAQLQAADEAIQQEDWKNAVLLLQELLDGSRYALTRAIGRDGKTERYINVHTEAERMLAALPPAGRKEYQRIYGPRAAALLHEAHERRDAKLFAHVVEHCLYTEAAPVALGELAGRHYKDGQMVLAALAYARLLEHVGPARWTNIDLYQASLAFQQRGMSTRTRSMLKELIGRARQDMVKLGKQKRTIEELRKEFASAAESSQPGAWSIYRGDAARSNRGAGGSPVLEALWRQSMLYDRGEEARRSAPAARNYLRQAEKKMQARHEPIIPAFTPIAVTVQGRDQKNPLLVCRSFFGVMAIDLRNGSLAWASPSTWSLQRMLSYGGSKTHALGQWLSDYQSQHPQILFENSTVGTLSTDGQFVYVIEDLAVPPYPQSNQAIGAIFGGGKLTELYKHQPPLDKDLEDAVLHNRLYAFDLSRSGALSWSVGEDEKDPLRDSYFLGPPLPLGGLLYVLVQKKQQISLVCIDPHFGKQRRLQPKIAFLKPLVELRTPLVEDPIRRTQAAHLAYDEGILVCPTNAGVVFGVDLLLNRLAWAFPYRDKSEKVKDPPFLANSKHWKTTAPIIADGKVVFAPPDSPSLHCLNLMDGSLLWSCKKNEDDLYLAGVYADKVLIVGKKSVRALSLTKGETLWTQETGLPSGQGIAAGDVYYLPLERGAQTKQPEILVLDINKGQVIAHNKTRPRTPKGDDFEVPGNLLFVEDKLISLTPWEIVAYPLRGK